MKKLIFLTTLCGLLAMYGAASQAATCQTVTGNSGNWTAASRWSCGHAPDAVDDVIISSGDTIAINTNSIEIKSLTVDGTLNGNSTNFLLAVSGNLLINQGGTFNAPLANASVGSGNNTIGGNLVNNGTFNTNNSNSGNWVFNGTSAQTISGNVAFPNVGITNNNAATGVTVINGTTLTIKGYGYLNLTSARISTDSSSKVYMASDQCNTNDARISGGWVNGNLQYYFPGSDAACTFKIGDASNYAPVTLKVNWFSGIGPNGAGGTLTASTKGVVHPNLATSGLSTTKYVRRYWTIGSADDDFSCVNANNNAGYTATFTYVPGDIQGGASTGAFSVGRYSGGWATPAQSGRTSTSTTLTVAPVSGTASWGTYAIGEISGTPSGAGPDSNCSNAAPVAEWRMDEAVWNGTANEVKDSVGSYHGTAGRATGGTPTATTTTGSAAFTSGSLNTCRYGYFDDQASNPVREYTYVRLGSFPSLPPQFTFAGWIRTTNRTVSGQRILVNDDEQNGWALSLGDAGAGILRFFNRNLRRTGSVSGSGSNSACGTNSGDPFCLDTTAEISNNTWYFVAASVDNTAKRITLYVFNQNGSLQTQVSSAYTNNWANGGGSVAIGGETSDSGEGTQSAFHFKGNIDEFKVYGAALSVNALANELTRSRTCATTAVHHYELRLPATSLSCVPNLVTVVACTDSATPCSNPATSVGGQSAGLATSAGSLGDSLVTFGTSGSVSTTLRYPTAAEDATATVTLSNESVGAQTARVCCVGNSCSVANSCATTFKTAGFVFSNSAAGDPVDISSQIAGSNSATYYLRAVRRSSTSTSACEAALTGTRAVDFAYECYGNPSTCDANNRMTVSGTTIARNNKDTAAAPVSSYLPVNLTFDANGSASFALTYGDVGQLRLWVRKAVDSTTVPPLLTALTATSNAFVVKPYDFGFVDTSGNSTIVCGGTINPAAADANGGRFCAAGNPFSATVRARTAGGTTTPSFGRCDNSTGSCADEKVVLAQTLVAPSGGENPALGGTLTANATSFASGSYSFSNLRWNEVGIIRLKASNGNYLSNSVALCSPSPSPGEACQGTYGDSGNVGRFYPLFFKTEVAPPPGCSGFVYAGHTEAGPTVLLGQPMTVKITAKYAGADDAVTKNYKYNSSSALSFAKNINLTLAAGGGATGNLYVDSTSGGSNAVLASKFTAGTGTVDYSVSTDKAISYVFGAALPVVPTSVTVHADDADYPVAAPSANTGDATIQARFGRLRLSNAFGTEKQNLKMPVMAQYWSGNSWLPNGNDSCTTLDSGNFYLLPLGAATTTVSGTTTLNAGGGEVVLTPPPNGNTGSVDVAVNLGSSGNDLSCLTSHGGTAAGKPWLRSRNGNCAATYNRDPSARATFGIYSPEGRRVIHARELF